MSDPQREIRLWLQEELAQRPHGTKGLLAKFLGVRPDAITRMANTDPHKETREIRAHELVKMREFFQEAEKQHADISVVPVMGYLGAGAEVEPEYEQVPPEGLDQIQIPFQMPDDMIAFKVRGESMLPVYKDGAVIITYREQKKPLQAFYGEEAAVRTSDGRRFIKTIMRGQDDTVNLLSHNASPIEGVRLEWIGEIFAVIPPGALRSVGKSVEKEGGIQGQLKLRA